MDLDELRQTRHVIDPIVEDRDIYNAVMSSEPSHCIIVVDAFAKAKVLLLLEREEKRFVTVMVQKRLDQPAWIILGEYCGKQCFVRHVYESYVYASIDWGRKLAWLPADHIQYDPNAGNSLSRFSGKP